MNYNNYNNQRLRGLTRKYEAIKRAGGRCSNCGYDKNLAALEFHHIEPKKKEMRLDLRRMANTNIKKLNEELDKCKLLCANCHREEHNKDLNLVDIPNIIENIKFKKTLIRDFTGSICPICNTKFKRVTGKIYCSKKCREKEKGYPSFTEIENIYRKLKNWEKVANHFNLTRRIIQTIRKNNSQ